MQYSKVKQTAIKTVSDVYSIVIVKVYYDLFKHHAEKMLNRVGARTQLCFMPLMMGKDPERSLFNLTWVRWSLGSGITMLRNLGGGSQSAPWSSTVPFCLLCQMLWSGSQMLHTVHCSTPCILRMNTMSVVPPLALNRHWVSGRWSSVMVGTNLFRSTWARIFPAMESRVIPW